MEHLKRYILILFLYIIFYPVCAQAPSDMSDNSTLRKVFNAKVVNAETGEALPFVSIYVKLGVGTMTNEEGEFGIVASRDDVIHISYMGYEKQSMTAAALPAAIKLKPMSHTLQEVTIIPVRSILDKVFTKAEKERRGKENKVNVYFYRQVTSTRNVDFAEAFVKCRNAVSIRNMEFLTGRHGRQQGNAMLRSLIADMNFHHPLELSVISGGSAFWRRMRTPHSVMMYNDRLDSFYDYSLEMLTGEDGTKVYAITFNAKPGVNGVLLTGTLYVNASDYKMLSFRGAVQGMTMEMVKDYVRQKADIELLVEMNYRHQRGYTEVESINYSMHSGDFTSKALLFNIDQLSQLDGDDSTLSRKDVNRENKKNKHKKGKGVGENMLASLDGNGFDEIMKANADFVKRTSEENDIALGRTLSASDMLTTHYAVGGEHGTTWDLRLPDTKLGNIVNRVAKISQLIPQEKVYVHMDNTCYFLGDTIWLSAYLRRTSDDMPSTISGILYVELFNQDGYLMQRQMIEMKNGRGHGNFVTNSDWYGGYYELRAYTRWQLNWGVYERKHSTISADWFINKVMEHRYFRDYEKLYSRVFPMYDAPKAPGKYQSLMTTRTLQRRFKEDPDKRSLEVTFFPEGGDAVVGVPCRIAFEAAYNDGEYVDGRIGVKTKGNDIRYLGETESRGRGVFTYTPESQQPVTFVFTASEGRGTISAKLDRIRPYGVTINVDRQDSVWHVGIQRNALPETDSLGLCIMHDARVRMFREVTDSVTVFTFGNYELEPGVNQVTVFDSQGRVLAERLFFVTRPQQVKANISVSGMKDEYQPYEAVTLNVSTMAGEHAKEVVSVSVCDTEHYDFLHDNATMQTEMLLSSEIKGFVPTPERFFESDDEEHRRALDLLMMTQGWRRFNWTHMAVRGVWDLTQPDEQTPVIVGELYDYPPNNFYNEEEWEKKEYVGEELERMSKNESKTDQDAVVGKSDASIGDFATNIKEVQQARDRLKESIEDNVKEMSAQKNAFATKQSGKNMGDMDDMRNVKSAIPSSVKVHSRLVPIGSTDVARLEIGTDNGRFKITMPRFYSRSVFFIAASDTAKRKLPRGQRYAWIQGMPNSAHQSKSNRIDYPDYSLRIDFPYPRFVKPYHFFQQRNDLAEGNSFGEKKLSDGSYLLAEVKVGAKHSCLRERTDSLPAFIVDGYEAYNHALDAGMLFATPIDIMRSYVGDYGSPQPFVHDGSGNIDFRMGERFGSGTIERLFAGKSVMQDSIYMRSQLSSHSFTSLGMNRRRLEKIDKYVLYTDYQPRLIGSRKYQGSNLPKSVNVVYDLLGDAERPFYRDRRYIFDGIAVPDEFYSPDYSRMQLPPVPSDYRRTLYWNPALQLDSNGAATITFWNNSSQSHIRVQAEGMTAKGEILRGGVR